MKCDYCGKVIPDSSEFCGHCGNELGQTQNWIKNVGITKYSKFIFPFCILSIPIIFILLFWPKTDGQRDKQLIDYLDNEIQSKEILVNNIRSNFEKASVENPTLYESRKDTFLIMHDMFHELNNYLSETEIDEIDYNIINNRISKLKSNILPKSLSSEDFLRLFNDNFLNHKLSRKLSNSEVQVMKLSILEAEIYLGNKYWNFLIIQNQWFQLERYYDMYAKRIEDTTSSGEITIRWTAKDSNSDQ